MAPDSISSDEFSFPVLASQDSNPSCLDSPQLWKRSPPETFLREDHRSLSSHEDEHRKSFSYAEMQSRWSDDAEEKMDMLWEDLNDDLTRSRSLRIKSAAAADMKSFCSDDAATDMKSGRSMMVSKKRSTEGKKPNVVVFMKVLKKILLLRNSGHRSPAKTHPRRIL